MSELLIKRLSDTDSDIPLPGYATEHAAGMDIRVNKPVEIAPGAVVLAPTGIALEIPEGYEGQVRPRSGLAAQHGITCLNSPGTIDADYRGELKVILINHGKETVRFERGQRVAQLVISKYERVEVIETTQLAETARASGGFGHTGIH
ncbi:MAG: dUTP diphosphatase [Bacteroidota bacterium]|nr:dUTP diphosphatase [Bacteroidota bacterium]MDP4233053.1 dUTP diphosphatase [Bacteroidota bacterium]MDP4241802.1 dUTP diphosphatase [Bacteroidota bacterium]MDP4288777.1 dUTP diphosphatase [Bacteroidota bacterium]